MEATQRCILSGRLQGYLKMLGEVARDKHSSLLSRIVKDEEKKGFISFG
jgi:hypothetical protein